MAILPTNLTPRIVGTAPADCPSYNVAPDDLVAAILALKAEYPMLMDITAIDYGVAASPRYEAIYHLFSPVTHTYVRVACACFSNSEPSLPSVVSLYPAADWHEREAYDMMGITFVGHPGLKRILMWEGYPYHPLRKDFPLAGIETPLPAADIAQQTGVGAIAAPMMGGPFVAKPSGTMLQKEPRAKDESWTEKKQK